jgi:hypothetical protein
MYCSEYLSTVYVVKTPEGMAPGDARLRLGFRCEFSGVY